MNDITDDDIKKFLSWYFDFNERRNEHARILAVSASGRFHTTEKAATAIIRRAIASGFLKKDGKDNVIICLLDKRN